MENWFEFKTADEPLMLGLSQDEKKHKLFLDQKATLDMFLERGAMRIKMHSWNAKFMPMRSNGVYFFVIVVKM